VSIAQRRVVQYRQLPCRASVQPQQPVAETAMLYWTLIFLVVALVAGLFGFGGIASASAGIAKILFAIFIVLFLLSLVFGVVRGP
jgi:uncharacterized membrane protein YtjA (UPF0391 family)